MTSLKDINWNQVYCFYEVARQLSMKDAAKILGVSVPTISEQIKRLEKKIDVPLFHRGVRKISLTDAGLVLFGHARDMFEVGGRILDVVSPETIGGYPCRVGVQTSQSSAVAVDFLNQFWDVFAEFGTVHTFSEVLFETLMERLNKSQFDWVIAYQSPQSDRFIGEQIACSEFVFCCAPHLFQQFRKKEDILRKIPVAKSSWDTLLNAKIDDAFRAADIVPDETIDSDHPEFITSLALRGRCVAILPRESLQSSAWSQKLVPFTLTTKIQLSSYAIWAKGTERMIPIRKLKSLLAMNGRPTSMTDPHLQIRVGNIEDNILV